MITSLLLLFAAFTGCGDDLVSDLKGFEPNTPPEITAFISDITDGTEIYPTMEVNFTVEASDFENDPLEYSFESAYGTFRKLETSETGCTIQFFISSTCPTSRSIPVAVTVSDDKNGSSISTIDLGDGNDLPVLDITWNTSSVSFSADYSGYYQARVTTTDAGKPDFDGTLGCTLYSKGDLVSMDIGTSNSYDIELPSTPGTYRVFLIFYDNFQRQVESYHDHTVL